LAQSDADIAQSTPILYGGSMNPSNADELIACEDIDGGLSNNNVFESLNTNTLNHSVNLSRHHSFCVAGFSFF
jgi:triosephosphate isomerase